MLLRVAGLRIFRSRLGDILVLSQANEANPSSRVCESSRMSKKPHGCYQFECVVVVVVVVLLLLLLLLPLLVVVVVVVAVAVVVVVLRRAPAFCCFEVWVWLAFCSFLGMLSCIFGQEVVGVTAALRARLELLRQQAEQLGRQAEQPRQQVEQVAVTATRIFFFV